MLKKCNTFNSCTVFDFTDNDLRIGLFRQKDFIQIKRIPFDLMLQKEDIKNTKTISFTNRKQGNDPIELSDFHQLLSLMIANTDIIKELWKIFFKQHEKAIHSLIQKVIVFVMPMIYEPEIKNCIVNAFQVIFGNKLCIHNYSEAIPTFFLGLIKNGPKNLENLMTISVPKEKNKSTVFSYSLKKENEKARVQFLGWQNKNMLDIKNNTENGNILEGVKWLFLFSNYKYLSEIHFSDIQMYMPVEVGVILENGEFISFSEHFACKLSLIKPSSYLEMPLFAKLPKYPGNYFFLKPYFANATLFKRDYSKIIEITVQEKKRVGQNVIISISGQDFEDIFTYPRPVLYS